MATTYEMVAAIARHIDDLTGDPGALGAFSVILGDMEQAAAATAQGVQADAEGNYSPELTHETDAACSRFDAQGKAYQLDRALRDALVASRELAADGAA